MGAPPALPPWIMSNLTAYIDWNTIMFVVIGFGAQLCDGALGMGFGVISSTVLTLIGLPRVIVSATVNTAKILTGTASTVSHLAYRNVEWRTLAILGTGGVAGALAGSHLLLRIDSSRYIGPFISAYLIGVGIYIIWKVSYVEKLRVTPARVAGIGVAAGFLEAVAGVWGPLATSNLVASGLAPRLAVGVGNVAETLVAVIVSATLVNELGFDKLSRAAVGLVIGALIASPIAARLTANLPKRRLAIGVGILVILSSTLRLLKETGILG
jgi:uncharacterized membrane protein YfcA